MKPTFAIDNPASWAAIAPQLKICDVESAKILESFEVDPSTGETLNQLLRTEGYFQTDPQEWNLPLADMAEAVGTMRSLGLSTCFAFMYDEFWLAFAKLDPLLKSIMGDDYRALPAFWAWHVDPASDESGWRPHRDMTAGAVQPDGTPKAVSVWLPLTDATTLNGCMYIVPADRDAGYFTGSMDEMNLRDVRALPAAAGSVLCWSQALLHWGSHSVKRATAPRVSIAFEFQRGDAPPFRSPLLEPGVLPTFEERLELICAQILFYVHMYDVPEEMTSLAKRYLGISEVV